MKRISVTGADRAPDGSHHLSEAAIMSVGGVTEGEAVIIRLNDEPIECEAIVTSYPGWEPSFFAREIGHWRDVE